MFMISSCGASVEKAKSNIAYGKVVETDEKTITVEGGEYSYGKEFEGNGEEISYNLPESVFFDDFKKGDIVAILFDGKDATAVTNVKYKQDEQEDVIKGEEALIKADNKETMLSDEEYGSSEDNIVGILSLNPQGRLDLSRISVEMKGKNSAGVASQAGGYIEGDQLNILTTGNVSPALKTYDKNSVIDVSDGNIETTGENSPCISSSGNISISNITAVSHNSSALSIKAGGIVNLKDSNILSYSGSVLEMVSDKNDTDVQTSKLIVNESSLRAKKDEALMKISGEDLLARFISSSLSCDSGILADITSDNNRNGGKLLLYGVSQDFNGWITCDHESKVKLVLSEGSKFKGAINIDDLAYYSKVYISGDSDWELTADSYISSIVNEKEDCSNINSNGYNIYYDKDRLANKWLEGRSVELKGGGMLTPSK